MSPYQGCNRQMVQALRRAGYEAARLGSSCVRTEHLLLALARMDHTQAGEVLVQKRVFGYTLGRTLAENAVTTSGKKAPRAAAFGQLDHLLGACQTRRI